MKFLRFSSLIIFSFICPIIGAKGGLRKRNLIRMEQRSGADGFPLDQVPIEIHRLAAQLLQDNQGAASTPDSAWESATFENHVRVLQRPDVHSHNAYFEFCLQDLSGEPVGFIIVSNGNHDYPVAHWDFQGLSPTKRLDEISQEPIVTYFKLDTLSYVGENAQGELVATLGQLPPDIEGLVLDNKAMTALVGGGGVQYYDGKEGTISGNQAAAAASNGTSPMGSGGASWRFASQRSDWTGKKGRFAEEYRGLILDLKIAATVDWEAENLAQQHGEALFVNEPHELALLFPLNNFDASGNGTSFVTINHQFEPNGREYLIITATGSDETAFLLLDIVLEYDNGVIETKQFVIVSQEALSNMEQSDGSNNNVRRLEKEEVHWGKGAAGASSHDRQLPWSGWQEWFAGGDSLYTADAAQRRYDQIPNGQYPNFSGCPSGCGATAWAMLFGWTDYMASIPNSGWEHCWGIYREQGLSNTPDAVAPMFRDEGVNAMIMEIRNDIGTECVLGNAPTYPGGMSGASSYLQARTGATIYTGFNEFGFHSGNLMEMVRDSIRYRSVPGIIGTGWLEHYPLAWGYRYRSRRVQTCVLWECWTDTEYQQEFYINNGDRTAYGGWIPASTWFAGLLWC